ncbi:MAG: GTPase ObgE [Candidatus Glassbacteria bacterium]|nr:GTPase ObgE [Candidatus Glassbacteria bacterium]
MFVDLAEIRLIAGDGGKGLIAFRREKFNSRGGPSGGAGGRGGDIFFEADQGMATLMDFRYKTVYRAPRGAHGGGNNRTGRSGTDVTVKVPVGTLVRDAETGEQVGDLTEHGSRVLAARGGRGGRGNSSFASSTRRAPQFAQDGEPGQSRTVALELKLIADVGLVGFPNAGKSTLLSRISQATPKIADYPFTTLTPNLGVAVSDNRSFVVADIPGLIEGAHSGKGLGLDFLRHIERTLVLVLLIDISAAEPRAQYDTLLGELASYSEALTGKPRCLVFSKLDLVPAGTALPEVGDEKLFLSTGISAVSGLGLEQLLRALADQVARVRSGQDPV